MTSSWATSTSMAQLAYCQMSASCVSIAFALPGRHVALEELWGRQATQRLHDQLAATRDTASAAAVLTRTLGERLAHGERDAHARLLREAANRLAQANVSAVAAELGLSERHLRRVFHDALGVSPKAFAKLTRFQRALDEAQAQRDPSWASIAATGGYYDRAHLIADFRTIAGVTPRAFLRELHTARRI
jgi:AraC-like DNA-binding protein